MFIMIEHREYVRLKESLKIGYKVVRPPEKGGDSFSEDVCGGGIRFPVKKKIVPGTLLDLLILLPKNYEPIKATGEVVWSRMRDDIDFPCVVGVKFISIDDFDRGKIINYIRATTHKNVQPDLRWID